MKRLNKKKGFTIVELVIVIAVVGVLTAVLVPTFVNLSNKAREAENQTYVKNLNTQMAIREATEGKNKTMYEAMMEAEDIGFNVEKLTPVNGNDVVWDSVANRFAIVDKDYATNGKVVYSEGDIQAKKLHQIWKIYSEMPTAQTYSIYAREGWKTDVSDLKVGFDAGKNTGIATVSYTGATSQGQEVVIRTKGNMCDLSINGANDHVDHYGYAKETKVIAVNSTNSYHEYGTSNSLVVTAGKVVIETTGVVFSLSATESATATVSNNGGNVMASTVDSVVATTSFEINSLVQLESFRDATNSGETFEDKTVNLNVDITLKEAWTPISNYSRNANDVAQLAFAGEFNGNGHTIYGLTNVGLRANDINTGTNKSTPQNSAEVTYGFFASVNGAKIKNLKFANVNITNAGFGGLLGDSVAACVGFSTGGTELDSISVLSGSIEGFDAAAGVLGRDKGTSIKITNCSNAASVMCYQGAAGIACRIYNPSETITISNCTNTGNITSDYQGAPKEIPNNYDACYAVGIAEVRNKVSGLISNCTNSGTIARRKPTTGSYKEGHIGQITVDINDYLTKTDNSENGSTSEIN